MVRDLRLASLLVITIMIQNSGVVDNQPSRLSRLDHVCPALIQDKQVRSMHPADKRNQPFTFFSPASLPLPEALPAAAAGAPQNGFPSDEMLKGASIATGWPLASGYVVTNNHVVSGSKEVALLDQHGTKIVAWPVLLDEVNDLALLEVAEPHKLPPALPLSHARTPLGSSVFTIGFPLIDLMGKTPKLSNGIISGENGLRDDPCSYQTTLPIQPGNSGGPVLNMNGEVVGIVSTMVGIRDESSGTVSSLPNISCAIKSECLKELLPHLPSSRSVKEALANKLGNLETVAKRVQSSVMIVVAR